MEEFRQSTEPGFSGQHSEIISRYGESLPPISDNLAGVTVIVAHAEFDNDNFWRSLAKVCKQQDITDGEWASVYVVNNSDASATLAEGAAADTMTPTVFEGSSNEKAIQRFQENQKHLSVLKTIHSAQQRIHAGEDQIAVL